MSVWEIGLCEFSNECSTCAITSVLYCVGTPLMARMVNKNPILPTFFSCCFCCCIQAFYRAEIRNLYNIPVFFNFILAIIRSRGITAKTVVFICGVGLVQMPRKCINYDRIILRKCQDERKHITLIYIDFKVFYVLFKMIILAILCFFIDFEFKTLKL